MEIHNDNLGIADPDLKQLGAYFTAKEIGQQPNLWLKLHNQTKVILADLQKFLVKAFATENLEIILTGAGSSAFIGDVLEGPIQRETGIRTKSVATTDLVTHPELTFTKDKTVLLISFARSGNSPESSKSLELADQLSKKAYHLIITCSPESDLLLHAKGKDCFVYFMPEESNDQSLAMTSSFTCMLLAGLFVSRINRFDSTEEQVKIICRYGAFLLDECVDKISSIADLDFKRAVFLGSGLFGGIAEESHLKLQELTNGKVICKCDTFLGFRHGPEVVIDKGTLVTYIFSNNQYVNKYEKDLVRSVKKSSQYLYSVGIMEEDLDVELDCKIILSTNGIHAEEDFLAVVSVLPAQLLGFYKSIKAGLQPDTPSENGLIHRVVQGVNIYPYAAKI